MMMPNRTAAIPLRNSGSQRDLLNGRSLASIDRCVRWLPPAWMSAHWSAIQLYGISGDALYLRSSAE